LGALITPTFTWAFSWRSAAGELCASSLDVYLDRLVAGQLAFAADRAILRIPRTERVIGAARRVANNDFTLLSLLGVAVLEEILFRGWFVQASRLSGSLTMQLVILVLSVLAFGLLHLQFGVIQVLAKLPLGALALAAALITGTVLAPIVAHMLFNERYWRAAERR
jgi:membrane protease YdiL (CAAX protease family)